MLLMYFLRLITLGKFYETKLKKQLVVVIVVCGQSEVNTNGNQSREKRNEENCKTAAKVSGPRRQKARRHGHYRDTFYHSWMSIVCSSMNQLNK